MFDPDQTIAERYFDDLGRVLEAKNFNPALSWLPVADRTVTQHVSFDALGRVKVGGLTVGLGTPHEVFSRWSVIPPDVWQRRMEYPVGSQMTTWLEKFDHGGRLARKERLVPGGSPLRTSFEWLGGLYVGRVQDQTGRPSPFREHRDVDSFGRVLQWRYTAIDLDQGQQPIDPAEGATYCGGHWLASECARPLLDIAILRDVVGQIMSLKWRSGHPVFHGGILVPTNHPKPWRGYTYNPMGQLGHLWEHPGVNGEVAPDGLMTHFVTAGDIQRLGASSDQWEYLREPTVGGTKDIRHVTSGNQRWSLATARGPGHQIQQLTLDGTTRTLTYDPAGRAQTDGARAYVYDPRGQLAAVIVNSVVVESYAYDASGLLAAVFPGTQGQPATTFAYDGDQMVAAHDARNQALWAAAWAPGLDQLLEWRDMARQTGDHLPIVDHRNSVVATWSPQQGRITQTAEYSPEGRLLLREASGKVVCQEDGTGQICANPAGLPFGFVSAWRSQASGLVYLRNRWYSPELGQFVSHDPLGFIDSYNLYAYAAFDPINNADPFGLGSEGMAATKQGRSGRIQLAGSWNAETRAERGAKFPTTPSSPSTPSRSPTQPPRLKSPQKVPMGYDPTSYSPRNKAPGSAERLHPSPKAPTGSILGWLVFDQVLRDLETIAEQMKNWPVEAPGVSGDPVIEPERPQLPVCDPCNTYPREAPSAAGVEPIREPGENADPVVASAKERHDLYVRLVLGDPVREKVFRTPWSADFGLGTRRFDDFYQGIGYEGNTTPWSRMTREQLSRKLDQVGSDFALLKTPNSGVRGIFWFGTEPIPDTGLGAELGRALLDAGIWYFPIFP